MTWKNSNWKPLQGVDGLKAIAGWCSVDEDENPVLLQSSVI